LPAGDPILDPREQRTGISVSYNKDTRQFVYSSGSTGEASQITMGRSALATDSDVTSQIDSFDFSTFDYTASQRIQLEINGRTFNYDWVGVGGGTAANQAANLFAGIQRAYPVTFTESKERVTGTTTVREVQEILVNGGLQRNDVFAIDIAIPGATSAVRISTDALVVNSTQTQAVKLDALVTAINTKINATAGLAIGGAVNNPATPFMVASRSGNKIIFTYKQEGAVGPTVAMKQTTRGSDILDPTLTFTDQTVTKSFYEKTEGNATTVGVHSLTLKSMTGTSPTLAVNDVYRISLPLADGTILSRDVTLGATGFAGLAAAAAADNQLNTYAVFAAEGTDKLVTRYRTNGAVTGTMNIEQIKVAAVLVRPESIGPISIKSTGTNLEIDGNPDGSRFRLTMRVNGAVKGSLPVGAGGSTSRNGLIIGQAKQINYLGSNDLLGLGPTASTLLKAGTGLVSTAAKAVGTRAITPLAQTFFLNESLKENEMTFTVDGIVGTISLPIRAYTGDTFATAIQDRVNQIQDPKTGRIVSGVTVKFEPDANRLVFTSGTTGANSQMNVVGHPNFGLATVTQSAGSVPIITILKQATDSSGNKLFVTTTGAITTTAPTSLQNWYPLYLTEGQLTFDTIGKLISPKEGVVYSPFDPQNGSDLLRLNIDYGKFSTQFSSPFSVLSLSQDGFPSGSLNGLDIDAAGTVRANYTNGQTVALGKVMIANFANPNGLKQIGNANYVSTSTSGQVVLGQAGADGFGTIKAGALERSNVDITEELVTLITAQRNFQANAKAIETTTTLSQTIIQIRG
jgi:flagellar hook protein FlgE